MECIDCKHHFLGCDLTRKIQKETGFIMTCEDALKYMKVQDKVCEYFIKEIKND